MNPALREVLGIALLVVGLLFVPVPIVPGTPLIAAGAAILGRDHRLIRPCLAWWRNRGFGSSGASKEKR